MTIKAFTEAVSRRQTFRFACTAGAALLTGPAWSQANTSPLPVGLVNTSGNTSLVLGEVMKRKGFLESSGVTPAFTAVSDGSKAIGALLGGDSDICIGSGFSQVLPAIEAGGAVKIVAGAGMLAQFAVYSSRPEIKRVTDLPGRTIGTGSPGSLLHQIMVTLLKKKGVSPDAVKFVNVGSNADVFRAVSAGTVDAGPGDFDLYDQQAKFGVHSLEDGDLWSELPEYTSQASFASVRAIQNKREGLIRVLAAYARLYRFIQSAGSQAEFREYFLTALPKNDAASADARWNFYQKYKPLAEGLIISEERVRYMQEMNVALGNQKKVLPLEQVVDNSLAEEALKRIG